MLDPLEKEIDMKSLALQWTLFLASLVTGVAAAAGIGFVIAKNFIL